MQGRKNEASDPRRRDFSVPAHLRGADFARGTVSPPLDPHVGRPLHPDPEIAQQLRPYERLKAAEANEPRVLRLPPPAALRTIDKPLPLPGGPPGALDPNPITSPRVAD